MGQLKIRFSEQIDTPATPYYFLVSRERHQTLLNESNKLTPALSQVGQEGADVSFGEVVQCCHNPAGTPLAGGQEGWRGCQGGRAQQPPDQNISLLFVLELRTKNVLL